MKSPPKKRAKLHSASQGAKARHLKEKPEDTLAGEASVFVEPMSMTLPADDVTLRNKKEETPVLAFEEE